MYFITRSYLRSAAALFMVLFMIFSLAPSQSSAAESVQEDTIVLTGDFDGQFYLDSSDGSFFSLEEIMPGTTWCGKLNVINKADAAMDFSIISITNNLMDDHLYKALDLRISVKGETLYAGSYGATTHPVSQKHRIAAGETLTYDIYLSLPDSTGNELMGQKMESTWVFEADYFGDSLNKMCVYQVKYIDKNGKELAPGKHGRAGYKTKVTEQAKPIVGYIPDAQKKSIVIGSTLDENTITFVYSPKAAEQGDSETSAPAPVDPGKPEDSMDHSQISKEPDTSDQSIKTGVDKTESNTSSQVPLFVCILLFLAIGITYARIKAERNRWNSPISQREEDPSDGKR